MEISDKLKRILYISSAILATGGALGLSTVANADSTTQANTNTQTSQVAPKSTTQNAVSNSNTVKSNNSSTTQTESVNSPTVGSTPSFIMNGTDFTAIHNRTPNYIWNEFYHPLSSLERKSKEYVAFKESSGFYNVSNGQYHGRFQLTAGTLHHNYSKTNQEKSANQYVSGRYGTWYHAALFHYAHGWY